VNKSGKNDVIVCWFDFQAILCYWISVFLFKPRKIIAINIMLKDKKTLKNKAVSLLYKIALKKSHRLSATVTSGEWMTTLNKKLGMKKSYAILHDAYSYQDIACSFKDNGFRVFTGGLNGRDWNTAIYVAKSMPDVEFYFVCSKEIYDRCNNLYPNVFLFHDILVGEFIEIQKKCSVTYLPLDTMSPAGLIVMYQAAALSRFVIITDTPVTREYISENTGCLVGLHQTGDAIEKIRFFLNNPDIRREKSDNLKDFLQKYCSEEAYVEKINNLIEAIFHNK
jgi:hypothetical protein